MWVSRSPASVPAGRCVHVDRDAEGKTRKGRERRAAPAAASPQRFGSWAVVGRYPGSRVLTHRLPALARSGVLMRPHSLTVAGAAQALRDAARAPVSRLTVAADRRHGTADKRGKYSRARGFAAGPSQTVGVRAGAPRQLARTAF